MRRNLLIGVAIAGVGLSMVYAFGWLPQRVTPDAKHDALAQSEAPPLVSVVKAEAHLFHDTVLVSGSLSPREEILVAPEIEGFRVLSLHADVGTDVKKGEVLARLVAAQLDAQVAQSDAALARATAAIAQANSRIVEAEARAKEAAAQLERAVPLKREGYLSGSTYDQRQSAADTAQAQLVAAQDGLKAAEAEKAQVEAQRRELDWRRGKTEVTSPADGIVSERNARIGGLASSLGAPMFRIIENSEIELDAEIVETDLYKVKAGQPVTVSVPGYQDVAGTVRIVSPAVDSATRLGHVRIFLGRQPQLKIGAFARGIIEIGQSQGIALPTAAVTHGHEGTHVLVVRGDTVHERPVKTGLLGDGKVEILEGVAAGDVVVARAATFLRDGDRIRPDMTGDALIGKVSEAK